MVFGWGKKKSQKQESDIAPQKKQILLSDVPNVANEIRSIRTKRLKHLETKLIQVVKRFCTLQSI